MFSVRHIIKNRNNNAWNQESGKVYVLSQNISRVFCCTVVSSKYAAEGKKLCQHVKTIANVLDYSILIQFLCTLCPDAGKQFRLYVAEEGWRMTRMFSDSDWKGFSVGNRIDDLQLLVCKCMR